MTQLTRSESLAHPWNLGERDRSKISKSYELNV